MNPKGVKSLEETVKNGALPVAFSKIDKK